MATESGLAQPIRCDALFLSNAVENRQGLIFVLGGAWTRTWPQVAGQYPFERVLPITAILRIPYSESNIEHKFTMAVRDSDEKELARAEGSFKLGRDVDLTQGMSQVVPVVLAPPVRLEEPGIYFIVLGVDGEELHRIAFEALRQAPRQN